MTLFGRAALVGALLFAVSAWGGCGTAAASEACPKGTVAEITATAAEIGLPVVFSADKTDIEAVRAYVEKKFGEAPFNWADVAKVGAFTRKDGALMFFAIDKADCSMAFIVDSDPGDAPKLKPMGAPMLLPNGMRLI